MFQQFCVTSLLAVAILACTTAAPVEAQYYRRSHVQHVPHTTTHTDYVQHGNHVDAVPHTTTHVDTVYGGQVYQGNTHRQYWPQNYNYGNTHYYPQGNHVVYGSQYHVDTVPHTQTHIDYVRHGNHVDAVPHTQTHYHQVPHYNH